MDAKKFGAFVQERRKALGRNQTELAEQLHVTAKAVSRWERGVGFPDIKLLQPLADALDVTVAELLHGERIQEPLSKEEASAMVTQTVKQIQEQEQLSWKRRLLLYLGNTLLFLAYAFLYMLAYNYPWQNRWLVVPIIFIAVYGFHYGTRMLKAILTGTKLQWKEMQNRPMTAKMWAAVGVFLFGIGLVFFTVVRLDDRKALHDLLVVIGLMLSFYGGIAYLEQVQEP
jgi:transcriptional regulator with XRE-family HTH domain